MNLSPFDAAEYYDVNQQRFARLLEEVNFALVAAVHAGGIKTHTITARVKERDSYLDKAERINAAESASIRDVVGLRVVCLFLSDLPRLREVVEGTFEVLEVDDKVEGGDVTSFGYMSVHYICRLPDSHSGPRYDDLKGVTFEIQCRTVVMDAWANVSHYLAYKGEASVPGHLRRDFNALSGLFYVADQHFELFFSEAIGSRTRAAEQVANREDQGGIPINLDTVLAYLSSKYPDRRKPSPDDASELVEELADLEGYDTIADLDKVLSSVDEAVLRYEQHNPPATRKKQYAAVGLARMALAIADPDYATSKYEYDESFDRFR